MSSSFGTLFRVTTFGESHCPSVGAVVDVCPANLELSVEDIQVQLDRRRPGQSELTTKRDEADQVAILSGVERGRTLGTPIALRVDNRDQRPGDYREMSNVPRPSHADFTYQMKYGIRASSGGGRASARETIGRVAAGAIAEKILQQKHGIEIIAWVSSVGTVDAPEPDLSSINRALVDANDVRCPDSEASDRMRQEILAAKEANDSIGGVVTCICRNVPAGWGEPIFDKLEAMLAHAMLSIPASKGFEVGSGFAGARMRGSEHNDPFIWKESRLGTSSNYSGGIQGGISNGETILFRTAFKPAATIGQPQTTADFEGVDTEFQARGRHDPCILPRAVPVVESMATLVLIDMAMRQSGRGLD